MPVTLRLEGADELERALNEAATRTLPAGTYTAMVRSLLLVEGSARRRAPSDTRQLKNSITHRVRETRGSIVGEVGPSARYGLYVERGSRPHWPPRAALEGWARRHRVPVFVVQRAIARKGTRARPFLVPAYLQQREAIVRLFRQVGAGVVARIGATVGGRP